MDPISQAALGAAASQNAAHRLPRKQLLTAALLGVAGGMAPDLDVFIRSSTDPLLFLEYHRHFSHSLFFIPFGGLIVAAALHPLFGKRQGFSFLQSLLFATLGYATHALLDACTTYGTLLLWPLSDTRFAWNTISVVDPLYTLPILALLITHLISQKRQYAILALSWIIAYPTLGLVQRDRAEAVAQQLLEQRGHGSASVSAKPSMANLLVWKTVYEFEGRFYVDAVRVGIEPMIYEGESIIRLNVERDFPWLSKSSQQYRDIQRFDWFSTGYLALSEEQPGRIIDIRYSMQPNTIEGLWSITVTPDKPDSAHAGYGVHRRTDPELLANFKAMLAGRPLPFGQPSP